MKYNEEVKCKDCEELRMEIIMKGKQWTIWKCRMLYPEEEINDANWTRREMWNNCERKWEAMMDFYIAFAMKLERVVIITFAFGYTGEVNLFDFLFLYSFHFFSVKLLSFLFNFGGSGSGLHYYNYCRYSYCYSSSYYHHHHNHQQNYYTINNIWTFKNGNNYISR